MAIGLKQGAIPGASDGNKIVLNEIVTSTYALATPSAGTTTIDLGAIANSNVSQEPSKTEKKSEDGEVQKVSNSFTRKTTAVLMQEDADLLNWMAHTVKTKRYIEFAYRGYINSLYQWIVKFVEVTPQFNSQRSGDSSNLNYESTGVKMTVAQTITSTSLASISALLTLTGFPTAAITITVADQQAIVEV